MKILRQRNVVLFPDLGATEQWKEKIPMMQELGIKVELFNYLEENATAEQRQKGYDIADFLLEIKRPEGILQAMIKQNPNLKLLIEELDLELIGIEENVSPKEEVKPIRKRGMRR